MDAQLVTEVQQLTQDLLKLLGVPVNVVVEIDEAKVIRVGLSSESQEEGLGILIGYHGFTLQALQLILSLMINKGREEWLRIEVDVDGYRKRREEALVALAKRTIEKARFLGEQVTLPPMNAADRRIIHLQVGEVEDMVSESIGEDPRRRVAIRPRD